MASGVSGKTPKDSSQKSQKTPKANTQKAQKTPKVGKTPSSGKQQKISSGSAFVLCVSILYSIMVTFIFSKGADIIAANPALLAL